MGGTTIFGTNYTPQACNYMGISPVMEGENLCFWGENFPPPNRYLDAILLVFHVTVIHNKTVTVHGTSFYSSLFIRQTHQKAQIPTTPLLAGSDTPGFRVDVLRLLISSLDHG